MKRKFEDGMIITKEDTRMDIFACVCGNIINITDIDLNYNTKIKCEVCDTLITFEPVRWKGGTFTNITFEPISWKVYMLNGEWKRKSESTYKEKLIAVLKGLGFQDIDKLIEKPPKYLENMIVPVAKYGKEGSDFNKDW